MLGTIDLYNLALTPNDTMYFDSTETQTEWFDNQEHLSIDDISFNGARAFQLGKNYLDVIFNYNYVRYKLNDRYVYAFIENVDYTNDNCCALNISIDLTQTFLNELQTAIVKSNIKNSTEKNTFFKTYKPYSNKMPVSDYSAQLIGKIGYLVSNTTATAYQYLVGFIMINLELPSNKTYNILDINGDAVHIDRHKLYTIESGYTYPFATISIPVVYDIINRKIVDENIVYNYCGTSYTYCNINYLLTEFGTYLVNSNVGFSFSSFNHIQDIARKNDGTIEIRLRTTDTPVTFGDYNVNHYSGLCYVDDNIDKKFMLITNNSPINDPIQFGLRDYLGEDLALWRSPYCFIRIGTDTNYIDLNLLDFFNSIEIKNNTAVLSIFYFTSCLYPFSTTFRFGFSGNKIQDPNLYFNINSSSPLPYSVSAWQEYFSTYSASVNDGLATQQKYERQQDKLQLTKGVVSGAIDIATSFVPFTKAGYLKKVGGANDRQVMSGVINGGKTILNAAIDYSNSELEREKQRALLEIEWNDIKSSPSEFGNAMTNFTNLLYNASQAIEIYFYKARNFDDIKAYHKQYGYQINRMQALPWNTIKKHTVFDYISFNEITIKSSLPQFYTAMLEQQFEQGVRFWYDYNNFMNFDIPNEEIAGGSQ